MKATIRNIVFACPEESIRALAAFYAELLGMRVIREDWLVIARDGSSFPRLAFGDGPADAYEPPRWPDPHYPQQLHLDITVRDLEAAETSARRIGAIPLQDVGNYRSYADPVGHTFCLYRDVESRRGGDEVGLPGRLDRVVVDCPDPRELAKFYGDLLGMRLTVMDSPERVVIAAQGGDGPMLAFQCAPTYRAPRWPDPGYPQQLHLDLHVEDAAAAREQAERLGAIRLPDMGGSCPVYADPAAHPFCLCSPDQ
jgi:catechol 2,3-dioxygenase-like lactoylglutathione lyase family enzyme